MRKLAMLVPLLVCMVGLLSVVSPLVSAADPLFEDVCSGDAANSPVCQDANGGGNSIFGSGGVLVQVVNILTIIIGVAAVIVIIIAGIQYMLSTGDATKTNNAKNAILYALVGLGVAIAARVIVPFILTRL